jgi:hypothetical protein
MIATLTPPNLILGILVWYLEPSTVSLVHTPSPHINVQMVQPPVNLMLIETCNIVGGKNKEVGGDNKKEGGNTLTTPPIPSLSSLCDTPCYPTNLCPMLIELRNLFHTP